MLFHYDHRFSTYEGATQAQMNVGSLPRLTDAEHRDSEKEPLARYWVEESEIKRKIDDCWDRGWLLGWRDIARASDARTFVPCSLPRSAVGHKFSLARFYPASTAWLFQAVASSLMFNYVVRQKLSGTSMTCTTVKQVAAPEPSAFNEALPGICEGPLSEWIKPRVLELTYTSRRIAPYAREILGLPNADPGPPLRWDPDRRAHLQAELDAAMFCLCGLTREEAEHVIGSFSVIRKYEERDHEEFRTTRKNVSILDSRLIEARGGSAIIAFSLASIGQATDRSQRT